MGSGRCTSQPSPVSDRSALLTTRYGPSVFATKERRTAVRGAEVGQPEAFRARSLTNRVPLESPDEGQAR